MLQVYNLTTYPNLVGLLEQLSVDSEPSDMSFALSMDNGALEWGSHSLQSIFAQRRNIFSPSFYRMIWDVFRFGQLAPKVITWSSQQSIAEVQLQQMRAHHFESQGICHMSTCGICSGEQVLWPMRRC